MKIVIQTNADFTPKGKRTARVVEVNGRLGRGYQIRWYVAGRIYRALSPTAENQNMTHEWIGAQS